MNKSKIDKIINHWDRNPHYANEILQDVQKEFEYLPEEALSYIGDELLIPRGRLYQIATFYDVFKLSKEQVRPKSAFRDFMKEQNIKPIGNPTDTKLILFKDMEKKKPAKYKAVEKALREMNPDLVIGEIQKSGMIGRCGFGELTGDKWRKCADYVRESRQEAYIVCNADEGTPHSIAYRTLLESNPHAIIEGMILGAFAIGAKAGFLNIRSCQQSAIESAEKALKAARKKGLLGEKILDTEFTFDIKIRRSNGSYMNLDLGALVESLSGRPANAPLNNIPLWQKGYYCLPTLLSCAETWANIPYIIAKGAKAFSKVGRNGTKLVTLVGDVANRGTVEVALGTTLKDIIGFAGGVVNGGGIKAIQIGGPSGAFLPQSVLDIPFDYKSIENAGSFIGTGHVRVVGENSCLFTAMSDSLDYIKNEACDICAIDREGLMVMHSIVQKIADRKASVEDLHILRSVADTVSTAAQTNLAKTAGKMVLSVINNFNDKLMKRVSNGNR